MKSAKDASLFERQRELKPSLQEEWRGSHILYCKLLKQTGLTTQIKLYKPIITVSEGNTRKYQPEAVSAKPSWSLNDFPRIVL